MERFRDKELHNGDEMIGIWHARVSCCRTKHPVACRRLLLVLTSQRGCMGNRLTVWQDYNSSWRKTYKTRRAHWTWFPSLEYQSPNCFLRRSQSRSVKHQSFSTGTVATNVPHISIGQYWTHTQSFHMGIWSGWWEISVKERDKQINGSLSSLEFEKVVQGFSDWLHWSLWCLKAWKL